MHGPRYAPPTEHGLLSTLLLFTIVAVSVFHPLGYKSAAAARLLDSRFLSYGLAAPGGEAALADFDGDGRPDIAVQSGDTIRTFLNNGDGTLALVGEYTISGEPAAGDINNDGHIDLAIAASSSGNTVSFLIGVGDGTFTYGPMMTISYQPVALGLADFTADGHNDLVVLTQIPPKLAVYANNGNGVFTEASSYSSLQVPYDLAIGDLDRDGRADVVVSVRQDGVGHFARVYKGSGTGTFASPSNFPTADNPRGVAIADLNGDLWPDVVTANANPSAGISVLLNDQTGALLARSDLSLGAQTEIAIASMNGDGNPDLIAVGASVSVILGAGGGTFAAPWVCTGGPQPLWVGTGHFDVGGTTDVVVSDNAAHAIQVFPGNGDGTLGVNNLYATGAEPVDPVAADFNGDNALDIAVGNYLDGTISVLFGANDGSFQEVVARREVGFGPCHLAVADFNSDGISDLVYASHQSGTPWVMLGAGDGTFGPEVELLGSTGLVSDMKVVDWNGDGHIDVAAAFPPFAGGGGWLTGYAIWLGSGDGTTFSGEGGFRYIVHRPPTYGPFFSVGDVDGDGDSDAIVGYDVGLVWVIRNPAGSVAPEDRYEIPDNPMGSTLFNLNGDTYPDFVLPCGVDNLRVFVGTGGGFFGPGQNLATGRVPTYVRAGLLNSDAHDDLVTSNLNGSSASVFIGTGAGALVLNGEYGVGRGSGRPEISDVNDDGFADVIFCNSLANSVEVLVNRCCDSVLPGIVTDLTIEAMSSSGAQLRWTARGDNGSSGQAARYDLRWANQPITTDAGFEAAVPIHWPPIPGVSGSSETCNVDGLYPCTEYHFALRVRDSWGNWSGVSNSVGGSTPGVEGSCEGPIEIEGAEGAGTGAGFSLRQNEPNPMTEMTAIGFEVAIECNVKLDVFDMQGRRVRTLANGRFPAGWHTVEWDHRSDGGEKLGAGVYLYRIQAGSFRDQKKMVLLTR